MLDISTNLSSLDCTNLLCVICHGPPDDNLADLKHHATALHNPDISSETRNLQSRFNSLQFNECKSNALWLCRPRTNGTPNGPKPSPQNHSRLNFHNIRCQST